MKKTWRTPLEFKEATKQKFTQESLTVPGQVKSISEMLKRVERGEEWLLNGLEYTDSDDPYPIMIDLTDWESAVSQARTKTEKLIERAKLKASLSERSKTKEGEPEGEK